MHLRSHSRHLRCSCDVHASACFGMGRRVDAERRPHALVSHSHDSTRMLRDLSPGCQAVSLTSHRVLVEEVPDGVELAVRHLSTQGADGYVDGRAGPPDFVAMSGIASLPTAKSNGVAFGITAGISASSAGQSDNMVGH